MTHEKPSKSEATRHRILQAARDVFTANSFQAAGIRAIAEKAGVRHPLVVHYFKSKSALFETVTAEIQGALLENHAGFYNYLESLTPDRRMDAYLDGIIRQGLRETSAYRMILLNTMEMIVPHKPLPGLERMVAIHDKICSLVRNYVVSGAADEQTDMFMIVFTMAAAHFFGGRAFHRKVLGLESTTDYEDWVRGTMRQIFKPVLAALPNGNPVFMASLMARWRERQKSEKGTLPDGRPRVGPNKRKTRGRGEITRQRIIDAARQVFAVYPYDRATIRMIGHVGRFDFSRIHHMFPTKAELFKAVLQENFSKFLATVSNWQEGTSGMSPAEVFVHYLQKGLTYCFENRETLGVLVVNIAHYENFEDISGFPYMAGVHANMLEMVKQSAPPGVPYEKVSNWLYTIIMMGYTFAGAPGYPARLMNMDPDSAGYRRRVFEILLYVFMPALLKDVER
jgi:AcrR family transcriptional regulator